MRTHGSVIIAYGFFGSPLHTACWHWHVSSVIPLASAQAEQQYFSPGPGTQLQAGRAHLVVSLIRFSAPIELHG